jgi:hypothetical protein
MHIITGMHRSGTSLVAQLFYEAGADLGNVEHFYRSDKWNSDGYFEQPDIHAINIPLINGPWWKFAYFCLPSTRTILKRAEKRADQIRQTATCYRDKIVKETRFCLTLPAWLKYGAQIDRVLVCLRDPIQVARSIQRRNLTTLGHALHLWYIHNSRLLENAKEMPIWFVYYGELLDEKSFLKEMKGAYQFLGYDLTVRELEILRERCVKPHMNHHPEKTAIYPRRIKVLWQDLLKRHQGQF